MDPDTLQSILYGQLDVEIKSPSLHEQYEIVRAVVANPAAHRRLKLAGTPLHPWVALLMTRAAAAAQEASGV
jgi:hypothetical protein